MKQESFTIAYFTDHNRVTEHDRVTDFYSVLQRFQKKFVPILYRVMGNWVNDYHAHQYILIKKFRPSFVTPTNAHIWLLSGGLPEDPHPAATYSLDWCRCGWCQPMGDPVDQLCRRRHQGACTLTINANEFSVIVFHKENLGVPIDNRNDVLALLTHEPNHDNLRHASYRQYVLWRFDQLGQGKRVVIPAMWFEKKRSLYPSPDGTYKGFRAGRLDI